MRWSLPVLLVGLAALASPTPAAAGPQVPAARPLGATTAPARGWLHGALVVVAGASLGVALWRRHRLTRAPEAPALEVVAQVALGGKAKALWLRAANRELLLAVGPGSVQVLESWTEPARRGAEPAAMPSLARTHVHHARPGARRRAPLAAVAMPRPRRLRRSR